MMLPNQKTLRSLLSYNPETGELTWLPREGNASFNARDAWTTAFQTPMKNGYLCGRIGGKTYYAHRVIWKYVYGDEPPYIDHVNHWRADNRLVNLRSVSKSDNCRNVSMGTKNTSGHVGVTYDKVRCLWVAQIKVDKKNIHLGRFPVKEDAVSARSLAERKYGFHENHGKQHAA